MTNSYTQFVKKNFHSVRNAGGLTPSETISAIAAMWSSKSASPKRVSVQRRCSNKLVSSCHKKGRVCSQNTSRTRCHISPRKTTYK